MIFLLTMTMSAVIQPTGIRHCVFQKIFIVEPQDRASLNLFELFCLIFRMSPSTIPRLVVSQSR